MIAAARRSGSVRRVLHLQRRCISFELTGEQRELQSRVSVFVEGKVIPFERDSRRTSHGPTDELRSELVGLAKDAGLVANNDVHDALKSHVTRAVFFEAAGYSMLGPVALNIAAPDEGNMHMLELIATDSQRAQYLEPMLRGDMRSCFSMTEPPPGAGSDPTALKTTARPDGCGGYEINGEKWLITGANGAAFTIIMARTLDAAGHDVGASMFLAPMSDPAISTVRQLDTMDSSFTGGHAHLSFDGLRVGADAVLGEVGKGFKYAQVRLAPARLTHCMRWLGAATRAHDTAVAYANERTSFGKPLIDHQGISFQLADNLIDMHLARLAIWHAAWTLDQGGAARTESSLSKVACSEAIYRTVDRSLQVLGGTGVTADTEVAAIFADVRAFRIYDGASEVHRMSLGRGLKPRKPK
jgi:acyl-CoA dehydrogenase